MSLTDRSAEIERFVAMRADGRGVKVTRLESLSGGAIQENWALDVDIVGGPYSGPHRLVLRTDAATRVAASQGRAEEFALLKAAWKAGVAVPEPLWLCEDAGVIGRPFILMRRLHGVAASHRLARDPGFALDRPKLMDRLAEELANIHAIRPPRDDLAFLTWPAPSPAMVRIAACRRYLDGLAEPRPALEYGLRWAERHAPPAGEIILTHQDFRTGNYLVDADGLVAILDWEFAEWGDPMEDIGWFCAKCWRCGVSDREAGGIGDREDFVRAYERHSGRRVDQTRVRFWEMVAHLRWAVIALLQAKRHLSGGERSLELALTGRIVCELELEALRMIEAADTAGAAA